MGTDGWDERSELDGSLFYQILGKTGISVLMSAMGLYFIIRGIHTVVKARARDNENR